MVDVITYRAKHQTQRNFSDPYRMYNCAAYSMAMFIDRATLGGLMVNGETVRALTDEPRPDPSSPGLRLEQLDAVAARLRITLNVHKNTTFAQLRTWVKEGRGAILNGDRDQFGDLPCPDNFRGLHSVFVHAIFPDGAWLVSDPLCAKVARVPAAAVKAYAEKYGRQAGLGSGNIAFATTRPTPKVEA